MNIREIGSIDGTASLRFMQSSTTGLLSRGLRWLQARNIARKSTQRLQVCATVSLGEKRFVSVIECDGLRFLIGSAASSVSLLAQLPSQDASDTGLEAVPYESER